jgi:hypothetical protein
MDDNPVIFRTCSNLVDWKQKWYDNTLGRGSVKGRKACMGDCAIKQQQGTRALGVGERVYLHCVDEMK